MRRPRPPASTTPMSARRSALGGSAPAGSARDSSPAPGRSASRLIRGRRERASRRDSRRRPRLCLPASPVGCHTLPLGTFISVGRRLDTALDRVRLAERLGYHSVYTTHVAGRDSLTLLAAYANVSESIQLGTGVLPIYSRTPVATAQQAATIDETSHGRLTLGIGVSHRVTVENWYGAKIGKPVTEMRHYVAALRGMFAGVDP